MAKRPQSSVAIETGGSKHVYFESPDPKSSESKSRTIVEEGSETLGDSDTSSSSQLQDDLISVSCSGDINLPDEEALLIDPGGTCTGLKPDQKGAAGTTSPVGNAPYIGPSFKYPNPNIPGKFKRKPFVDLLTVQQCDELKIKPLSCDACDSDFIEFDEAELCDVPNEWGFCLLGCFAGKWPGMINIKKLVNFWNVVCEVLPYVNGCVIFRFDRLEDMEKILQGGPFHCLGRPLLLKIFDFENPPHGVSCASVPVWVKFPFLPGKYWNLLAFSRLCLKIGKPVCSDRPTFEKTRPAFARLLVDVDPTKPPPKSVLLKQPDGSLIEQAVVIDFFPALCKKCKNFGHFAEACGSKKPADPLKTNSRKNTKDNGKNIVQTAVFVPESVSDDFLNKAGNSTGLKTLSSCPSKDVGKVHPPVLSPASTVAAGSVPPIVVVDVDDPAIFKMGEAVAAPPPVVSNSFVVLESPASVQSTDPAAATHESTKTQNADTLDKLPSGPTFPYNAEKQTALNPGTSVDACPAQTSHVDEMDFSPALSKSAKKKLKKKNKKDESAASSSSSEFTGKPEGEYPNPSGSGNVSSQSILDARNYSLGASISTDPKSTSCNVPRKKTVLK
ncbi:hypothetical protein DH2020_022298 [Rehmannia glutinosa]|uniref:DUF4283 domain-containing protein n=1 Tax=Rehmannia glutinosa TaxID=99300 RepID=A0ABR0WCY0_REHGL